jgi:hypothetical protein
VTDAIISGANLVRGADAGGPAFHHTLEPLGAAIGVIATCRWGRDAVANGAGGTFTTGWITWWSFGAKIPGANKALRALIICLAFRGDRHALAVDASPLAPIRRHAVLVVLAALVDRHANPGARRAFAVRIFAHGANHLAVETFRAACSLIAGDLVGHAHAIHASRRRLHPRIQCSAIRIGSAFGINATAQLAAMGIGHKSVGAIKVAHGVRAARFAAGPAASHGKIELSSTLAIVGGDGD